MSQYIREALFPKEKARLRSESLAHCLSTATLLRFHSFRAEGTDGARSPCYRIVSRNCDALLAHSITNGGERHHHKKTRTPRATNTRAPPPGAPALGSSSAYSELGWGGWWFWDPVENASFVPWLLGTALVHSLAVTEARQGFRAWTALLAIGTFSFALLGTFIVRSGVLSSVHAFASDPTRGIYILLFLACLLYTSEPADDRASVDLGGRRLIKKKNKNSTQTI